MTRQQTAGDLWGLLSEQFDWLVESAQAYDRGPESHAKRIAVIIRTLLHDTQGSRSLLAQLGLKNTLRFTGPAFVPHYDRIDGRALRFNDWWSEPVLSTRAQQRTFSRRDLVLTLANKEGGAHVDPVLDDAYASLSRDSDFGLRVSAGDRDFQWKQNPFLPSVRQIAHEVLESLHGIAELSEKSRPKGEIALKRMKGWLHERVRSEREILAYHAAAHTLIAAGLGWWLGEVSIEARQEAEPGKTSKSHSNSSPHVPPEQCPIEAAMCDLAGFAAETWVNAKADAGTSSHTSFNHAAEVLGFSGFEKEDLVRDKYFHKLLGYLDEMLRERWSILEDLVAALVSSSTLSGEQVGTLVGLGLVRLGDSASFALKRSTNSSGYVVVVYPQEHLEAGNVIGLQFAVDYPAMTEDESPAVRARAVAPYPNTWRPIEREM